MKRLAKSPFWLTVLGGLLWWLAQPPVGWSALAWLAPLPWLAVIERPDPLSRKQWWGVWLAGVCYWLAALHWIRLPHPATVFGWPLLAGYMAMYLVLFVAITRSVRQRLRAPLWLVAPIVWVGLEWVQLHFMSGFLMAGLSHSQAFTPSVIQIAEIAGAYGISFVMLLCGCGLWAVGRKVRVWSPDSGGRTEHRLGTPALPPDSRLQTPDFIGGGFALLALAAIASSAANSSIEMPAGPTVALIQSNKLAVWEVDPDRDRKIMDRMVALSEQAAGSRQQAASSETSSQQPIANSQQPSLIIWPESMFRTTMLTFDGSRTPPPGIAAEVAKSAGFAAYDLQQLAERFGVPFLVGLDRFDQIGPASETPEYRMYNTAAITDARGEILATYDKTHLVPFGEYIPFAEGLPALYFLTPMSAGMGAGAGPVAMPLGKYTLSPSICYETVIPHVIRRHVAELTAQGNPPDVLVNITNDAWFWGSSELDMHLACAILRCVETRTPMVIAANGGLSAVIDASGNVRALSTRQTEQVLIETVPLDPRDSFYVRHGDWLAGSCAVLTVGGGLWALGMRMRERVMSPRR
jgi:apolipoprotein N-acyltransferase